jgi:hypothetical protein
MRLGRGLIDFDQMLKELDQAKRVEFDENTENQEFDVDDPPILIVPIPQSHPTTPILKQINTTVPDILPMQPDLDRSWSDFSSLSSEQDIIEDSDSLISSLNTCPLRPPLSSSDDEDNVPVKSLLPVSSIIEANNVKNVYDKDVFILHFTI